MKRSIDDERRGVWKFGQTLSGVLDVFSQWKVNCKEKTEKYKKGKGIY